MRRFRHEIRNQQRLFWRNRESAVFVFVFPPMLFLLLGAVYSGKIDGFHAAVVLLVGVRGTGKTVLGARIRQHARAHGDVEVHDSGDPPHGRLDLGKRPFHPIAPGLFKLENEVSSDMSYFWYSYVCATYYKSL